MSTTTATQNRNEIVRVARSQIGEKENPKNSNRTKFGKWYGWDGYAWCAMFVSWVFDKAGVPLGKINDAKGFRGCQSGYNHWKSTGELTKNPSKGDIVLFTWGGGSADHTGIFLEWTNSSKTKFKTIEGNTSLSNQINGNQVMERIRSTNLVKAFVKPNVIYKNRKPATVDQYDVLQKGDRGAAVLKIQEMLKELNYELVIDGDFGPKTEKTVKQFQKGHSFTQTGVVTPALKGYMQEQIDKDKSVPDSEFISGTFLKKGDKGYPVVELQKALNKAGIKPILKEDGDFGAKTVANVKAFQKKNQIDVDGIVGPQTWQLLLKS